MFSYIEIVPKEIYEEKQNKAIEIIGKIDIKDVPFISCALTLNVDGIWSDDAHFEKQTKIKVYKTQDLIKLL